MTLRDDIATYTFTYWDDFTDGEVSHPELMRTSVRMTNHILALIRDALLSDEAVNAATRTISVEVYPGNVFLGPDAGIVREGITAAIDAIAGEMK